MPRSPNLDLNKPAVLGDLQGCRLQVQADRILNVPPSLFLGISCSGTARKLWAHGGVSFSNRIVFQDDPELHSPDYSRAALAKRYTISHWSRIVTAPMGLFRITCVNCGQVNRATLPAPAGKVPRCRACRSLLEFALRASCPLCHILLEGFETRPLCRRCNLELDNIPLEPERPSDLDWSPPEFGLLERLRLTAEIREARLRDWHQRDSAFQRARATYGRLYADWAEATKEARERAEWQSLWATCSIRQLHRLSGHEFERLVQLLLIRMGYATEITPKTGDQGADVIARKPGVRIAIQAKRWKGPVGNGAIQQLLGGILYYRCQKGIVVTSSEFSKSARELASRDSRVTLWDRQKLAELYQQYLSSPPAFSREEYARLKKDLVLEKVRPRRRPRR